MKLKKEKNIRRVLQGRAEKVEGTEEAARRRFLKQLGVLGIGAAVGSIHITTAGVPHRRLGRNMSRKKQQLPTRPFGRTGFEASIIGLGGAYFRAAANTVAEGARLTHQALDAGINYLDVSPTYGQSESIVGEVMRTRREEVFLACKTLERSKSGAAAALRQSLKTLNTDRLDLFQFHGVDGDDELRQILAEDGALAAFLEAREAGLIRFIGITSHRPEVVVQALKAFDFDSVMVPINFLDRFINRVEEALIPMARARNVAVIGIKPWCREEDTSDTRQALRYALSQPISLVIPRHFTASLQEALEVARFFEPLSAEEELKLINSLGNRVCRQCSYCLPCPLGIDIPFLFRLEGYHERWRRPGIASFVTRSYQQLSPKANACNECGECEKKCPFEIPIITRLKQIHQKLTP